PPSPLSVSTVTFVVGSSLEKKITPCPPPPPPPCVPEFPTEPPSPPFAEIVNGHPPPISHVSTSKTIDPPPPPPPSLPGAIIMEFPFAEIDIPPQAVVLTSCAFNNIIPPPSAPSVAYELFPSPAPPPPPMKI